MIQKIVPLRQRYRKLNCTVKINYSIEARNNIHAENILRGLFLILALFELSYHQFNRAIDFWHNPENQLWPTLNLDWPHSLTVAGKIIVITAVSICFGLGVST